MKGCNNEGTVYMESFLFATLGTKKEELGCTLNCLFCSSPIPTHFIYMLHQLSFVRTHTHACKVVLVLSKHFTTAYSYFTVKHEDSLGQN